jgi:hypothetical protein
MVSKVGPQMRRLGIMTTHTQAIHRHSTTPRTEGWDVAGVRIGRCNGFPLLLRSGPCTGEPSLLTSCGTATSVVAGLYCTFSWSLLESRTLLSAWPHRSCFSFAPVFDAVIYPLRCAVVMGSKNGIQE